MIKDADELQLARHAGMVAVAMMQAGKDAAAPGVREFEVSLAAKTAGAYKAAELMDKYYKEYDPFNYPCLSFQQIMASGKQTRMCHHKTSMTKLEHGEPLFTCYCGTTDFNGFKLGFDRTFFIGEINNEVAKMLVIAVNETPQLAEGDKTVMQAGMVFAVDGGASGEVYRCQVGDSVIVTKTGYEIITPFTNDHNQLVCGK